MYKFLIFDLDDTLLDFELAEQIALKEFFEKLRVENPIEYINAYRRINRELWRRFEEEEVSREELTNTRFSKTFEHFGEVADGKGLAKQYAKVMGKQGVHINGAVEFLEKVSKDYEIYAATNGLYEIQKNRLKNSQISKYFKDVFVSGLIGYAKPKREFFEYLEKNISEFEKSKAVMIGDNIIADIHGANEYGIDTIWFNPNAKDNKGIEPTYEVKNYDELLSVIEKSNNKKQRG